MLDGGLVKAVTSSKSLREVVKAVLLLLQSLVLRSMQGGDVGAAEEECVLVGTVWAPAVRTASSSTSFLRLCLLCEKA